MKILIIYANPNPRNYNRKIHYGLIKYLKLYCQCDILTVGAKEIGRTSKDVLKVCKEYKPNVIISYMGRGGKNKMDDNAFSKIPCKKVIIDVDSWKKDTKGFYKSNKFDLIIHRGYYKDYNIDIEQVWLPFSAMEDFINPLPYKYKTNIVCGSFTLNQFYPNRTKYVKILEEEGLIKISFKSDKCKRGYNNYYNFINKHTIGLTSVENIAFKTPHAKMWEYISCKTVVLTPKFSGMEMMFPNYNDIFCVFDEEDLIEKTKYLIKNEKYRIKLAENAYTEFLKDHTHKKRAEELYNILLALKNGNKIPKKWGI